MKQLVGGFFAVISIVILVSCEQKTTVNDTSKTMVTNEEDVKYKEYSGYQKMQEIEKHLQPEKYIQSLNWEKITETHGSEFVQVEAYLDDDNQPIKIIEHYIDGNFRPQGIRSYYLEDNQIIGFLLEEDFWIDSNFTNYREKRVIYDREKPALTQERSVEHYEDVEFEDWTEINDEVVPESYFERVNAILRGTDHFDLHFISVIKADDLFLLLGEPKERISDRYTTAVRVDEQTPFITDLLNNLETYKFRPVEIQFHVEGGGGQVEYRVLNAIRWADEE